MENNHCNIICPTNKSDFRCKGRNGQVPSRWVPAVEAGSNVIYVALKTRFTQSSIVMKCNEQTPQHGREIASACTICILVIHTSTSQTYEEAEAVGVDTVEHLNCKTPKELRIQLESEKCRGLSLTHWGYRTSAYASLYHLSRRRALSSLATLLLVPHLDFTISVTCCCNSFFPWATLLVAV